MIARAIEHPQHQIAALDQQRDAIRAAVDSGELARDGDVFRQLEDIEPDPRDLVVTHNIATNSLSKLLFDEGENAVLIAPSLAVVNTKVDMLDQFGEITLLGTPDQIEALEALTLEARSGKFN